MNTRFNMLQYPFEKSNFNFHDLEKFLEWCVEQDVSDITIQNEERITCEIHGKKHLVTQRRLNKSDVASIIRGIHSTGAESTLNGGEELDFAWVARIEKEKQYRFRANIKSIYVLGDRGYSATMRYIKNKAPELHELNLPQEVIQALYSKKGIAIVSGPTGSGKSTTLAAVIQHRLGEIDAHIKISTFEKPIEFIFDHVVKHTSSISQCEIETHIPTFERGVRNSLRTRSDIVLIGEARDYATISAVIDASMVGPLVYTTCHTNNAAEIPARMLNVFPENEKEAAFMNLIDNLELLLTQKLVPSIDGKRVAIREYIILTQELKDVLIESGMAKVTYTLRKLIKEHGRTMLEDLTDKFIAGHISEEVFLDYRKDLH